MTATDLPAPLVPADVDLRGLPFMPLDVNRLRDSDLAIEASGDEFRAAVLLWCASWNQVPAGSLPNNDQAMAAYAGFGRDVKGWKKVAAGALRGFVECSDGRLYHPVVAEKAIDAWAQRVEHREKTANETERKRKEREDRARMFDVLREAGQVLAWNTPTSTLRAAVAELESGDESRASHAPVTRTGHAPGTAKRGTGKGEGEGEGLEPPVVPLGDQSQGQPAKKPAARAKPEGSRAKPKKPLQMPFLMTPEMLAWAKEKAPAVNLDRETERFCDYWTGTGKPMADWPSTWRNWMRRAQDDIERRGGGGSGGRPPGAPGDTSWIEEDDGV
ncbi:DUF1376 domain-containing protein [Pseudomonas sp. C11]|uniref:DUF1376 domain-containing protein n=1 Tax=Pseudomonas sp. C11 TaxID=3075550 RepID=UPI002AFEC3EC|nr:DUF1376 domain-containing protein [Pseudomonas sp. C11]